MIAAAPALLPPRDRRPAGIAATLLVHAVLILAWKLVVAGFSAGFEWFGRIF